MGNWLIDKLLPSLSSSPPEKRFAGVPEGLWTKCPQCDAILYRSELEKNQYVCLKCDHHMRIGARFRLNYFLNEKGKKEHFADLVSVDPLKFKDQQKYRDRLSRAQSKTGELDALVVMQGFILELELMVCAFEFSFMGGSMGSVVGEKFVRAAQICLDKRMPLVCFAASGGARMQESLFSLMQMAKTSAVLEELKQAGIPFISVLTDPVYGGVSASLAMLGDVHIAEPKAHIGFAGPRVIEQTVRERLPDGFQQSEFLLDHGMIDMIVHRHRLREVCHRLLCVFTGKAPSG